MSLAFIIEHNLFVADDLAEIISAAFPGWSLLTAADGQSALAALDKAARVTVAVVHVDPKDSAVDALLSRLREDGASILLIDGDNVETTVDLPPSRVRRVGQPYGSQTIEAEIRRLLSLRDETGGPRPDLSCLAP